MCNLDRVSGFLIAGKIAFIAIIVALAIAMANSISLFAAAANIPLMICVCIGAGVSTGMYAAAIAELDNCAGSCTAEIAKLRDGLVTMLTMMGIFTGVLIGLAVVAAIPFAGAAAIGGVIAAFAGALAGIIGLTEILLASATTSYNACRAAAGSTTISVAVIAIGYVAAVAGIAFSAGGFISGKIPFVGFESSF